jgi:hypothetical protein
MLQYCFTCENFERPNVLNSARKICFRDFASVAGLMLNQLIFVNLYGSQRNNTKHKTLKERAALVTLTLHSPICHFSLIFFYFDSFYWEQLSNNAFPTRMFVIAKREILFRSVRVSSGHFATCIHIHKINRNIKAIFAEKCFLHIISTNCTLVKKKEICCKTYNLFVTNVQLI